MQSRIDFPLTLTLALSIWTIPDHDSRPHTLRCSGPCTAHPVLLPVEEGKFLGTKKKLIGQAIVGVYTAGSAASKDDLGGVVASVLHDVLRVAGRGFFEVTWVEWWCWLWRARGWGLSGEGKARIPFFIPAIFLNDMIHSLVVIFCYTCVDQIS